MRTRVHSFRLAAVAGALVIAACMIALQSGGRGGAENQSRIELRSPLEGLDPVQKAMIDRLLARGIPEEPVTAVCFAPGTPDEVIEAFNQALGFDDRFQQNPAGFRWMETATDGPTSPIGEAITLTYSFVPDGTFVPSGVGEPVGNSDLFAWLDGLYGSTNVWQQLFHDMFDRWGEITGVTYVFEPVDDGADLTLANVGEIGVRGDVRISAKFINGNGGTLAYNNFPAGAAAVTGNGDMVIDSADSFYNALFGDSVRFRNVISHEHGHGLAMFHVCPVNQFSLMEPSIAVPYAGPQHDEIRGAHSLYGDPFEPDNTSGTAVDLGLLGPGFAETLGQLPPPAVVGGANRSIDADGEEDWIQFEVGGPVVLDAVLSPIGFSYEDNPQSCGGAPSSCCSGIFTNSLVVADLTLELIDGDGTTVLALANINGLGLGESITGFVLPAAGTYFVRVSEDSLPAQPQLYTLDLSVESPLAISLPNGAPGVVAESPTVLDVIVDPRGDLLVADTALLRYRFDGGAFQSASLVLVDAPTNLYSATLPGATSCDDLPEFFIEAEGVTSGVVTLPLSGGASPLTALVGTEVVIADIDFESDPGWTVTNELGLIEGAWEIGVPVNCDRIDPPADFDGSGQCYLTMNDALDCNSDVDDGRTTLETTDFDLSGVTNPRLSYARWFANVFPFSTASQEDPFVVEFSTDGGMSWGTLEIVGPSLRDPIPDVTGGWIQRTFDLTTAAGGASQFRVRFVAEDLVTGFGSVVEAGLDAFRITGIDCDIVVVEPCLGDADGSGVVDFGDVTSVLGNWLNDYTPDTGPGDADGNGVVDFGDVTTVLGNWLAECP